MYKRQVYSLVRRFAGYGYPMANGKGEWDRKEVCMSDTVVGYISTESGNIETRAFTIQYSDKGCHIVPKYEGSVLR